MSELSYRKLCASDIPAAVRLRMCQLKEEGAAETLDLTPSLTDFYSRHVADGSFVSWLALDGDKIVATSGMSFTEKPPYYQNPSGKIGLLSNMYTLKEYRRKGIAKKLLLLVVNEAKAHGCGTVHVTASDMGVLLYSDFGFHKNANFMQYNFYD